MLIGLGHDLQRISEIEAARALCEPDLFFTEAEMARLSRAARPGESIAAAFAAKEALFKALPPIDGWYWTDAELVHDARNAPAFRFHGALAARLATLGANAAVSMSHSGDFASAVVVVAHAPD